MTLVYCVGGGLGHLVRCRQFVTAQVLGECVFVSASAQVENLAVIGAHRGIRIPQVLWNDAVGLNAWLRKLSDELCIAKCVIDAFPLGLMGELDPWPFANAEAIHLARLMDWSTYAERCAGTMPRFDVVYRCEPLTADHEAALAQSGATIHGHQFSPLPATAEEIEDARLIRQGLHGNAPTWLIIHSGAESEIRQLFAAAEAERALEESPARFLLITTKPDVDLPVDAMSYFPARAFFPHVERVFCGAGFNCVSERPLFEGPWCAMAFQRKFDRQRERLSRLAANEIADGVLIAI